MNLSKKRRKKDAWFVALLALWASLTVLCYCRIIVFDGATIGGAMLFGFILTCSVLSLVQLLKIMYDKAYSTLAKEEV
jgi:hypothetical protein